jgi:hypothetical protein
MTIEMLHVLVQFFQGVEFVRKAFSTIFMARMAIKVYIIQKEIEQAFYWLFFHFCSSNRSEK